MPGWRKQLWRGCITIHVSQGPPHYSHQYLYTDSLSFSHTPTVRHTHTHTLWAAINVTLVQYLALVLYGEGTLDIGWEVLETANQESDSKQFLNQ